MSRYASHRSERSILGRRAGAPVLALCAKPPRPSTPHDLREFRRTQKRLMEERLRRRDRALAKRLGLLPAAPPARPKLPKPQPIAVTREQRARETHAAALRGIWADMAESGQDRIDFSPKTAPPTWDDAPRLKSPLPTPGASSSAGRGARPTPLAQPRSPASASAPAPRDATPHPRIGTRRSHLALDAERQQMEIVIDRERAKVDDLDKLNRHLMAFRSRLSLPQQRCGWGENVADECLALHDQLFAWRHGGFR